MRVERILVATDFSDNGQNAFARACDLARQTGAKIYLLHVQEESSLRIAIKEGLLEEGSTDEEVRAAVQRLIQERLTATLESVDRTGLEIESAYQRGDPKMVVVEYAAQVNADIVALGRRGITLMERVVGSVTECMIRKSPCPVLVVRREHK
jgi:nucleotide-binding universal stress UspA family protein